MRYMSVLSAVLLFGALVYAAQETVSIDGKSISIAYAAPAAKTRAVATFHTDADLAFKGMTVQKGDYTIYVIADGAQWQLAVNKASAKNASYDAKLDVGRVPMTMSKPAGTAEAFKMTLTKTAALAARLDVVWNAAAGSAAFHLDRGAANAEW